MLRAFQTASDARTADKSMQNNRILPYQQIKAALDALGNPFLSFLAMFFLMHAGTIRIICPFAPAFLCAAIASGQHPAALCAGCMAGMLRFPLNASALAPAISCALALAGELGLSFLRKRKIAPESRCAILSGICVLLPALFFAGGEAFASLQAVCAAAIATAAAPFFCYALKIEKGRKALLLQEKTGIFLLLGAITGGLQAIYPPAAGMLSLLTVLALSPMSAAAGVICGLGRMLGGAEANIIAGISLSGFVSGLNIYRSRWQKSAAVALTACLTLLNAPNPLPALIECLLPALAYALIPEKCFSPAALLHARPESIDPDRIAREIRDESSVRLTALAEAFAEMAQSCGEIEPLPDEQTLISEMRCRLCSGCGEYPACWNGADNHAVHFLCALIGEALDKTDAPAGMRIIYSDGEIPPDVMRFCRRGKMIPDRLGLLLRDFAEKRKSIIKRSMNNRSLGMQYAQAGEILYALSDRQAAPVQLQSERLQQLSAALERAQLPGCSVSAVNINAPEIRLRRSQGTWSPEDVHKAGSVLKQFFGGEFSVHRQADTLYFTRKPRFEAHTGVSCCAGSAGEICGDSHLLRMLNPSRLAVMLSDGMGSGEAAAQESAETLRLLWRFLHAGLSRPLAIETVNRHMLMRTGEEIYATMDLCIIDLNTGTAEFTKLAACHTLVLRGSEVLRIDGGNLPLGILEGVQPSVQKLRLKAGDTIIMASDGVLDACDAPFINRFLRSHAASDPNLIAEEMVREAALRRSGGRRDDMTCICLRISETPKRRKKDSRMA